MGKYNIDIDSFIGPWGYSKQYVKEKLNEFKDQEVKVRINSFGGSLDHGLDMMNRFKEHGKVTVYLCGFNASAATVASLGAKTIKMDANGFYLVHKVSNWVGEWGQMNADELDEVIQRLEKNKQENAKIDLVMAQMYASKTGKSLAEMQEVLTQGAWITAQEALDYGFVDELFNHSDKMNFTPELEEKFNAFGLPIPSIETPKNSTPKAEIKNEITTEEKKEQESNASIIQAIKEFFLGAKKEGNQDNKEKYMSKTDLTHLNKALGVTEIVFNEESKAVLSEEQLKSINQGIADLETEKAALVAEKEALTEQVETLKNADGDDTTPVDTVEDEKENAISSAKDLYNKVKDL